MTTKLDAGQKHMLKLVAKEQECQDGWAKVSKAVYPLMVKMPVELVELHQVSDGGGRARLTPAGQEVINGMAWM